MKMIIYFDWLYHLKYKFDSKRWSTNNLTMKVNNINYHQWNYLVFQNKN